MTEPHPLVVVGPAKQYLVPLGCALCPFCKEPVERQAAIHDETSTESVFLTFDPGWWAHITDMTPMCEVEA